MKKVFLLAVCIIVFVLANISMAKADEFVEELKTAKLFHNDSKITILYALEGGHFFSKYNGLSEPVILKPKEKIVFTTRPAYSKKKYPRGNMWITVTSKEDLETLAKALRFTMKNTQPSLYTCTAYAVSLTDIDIPGAKKKTRKYKGETWVEQWSDPVPILSAVFRVSDIGKTPHFIEVKNISDRPVQFRADITIAPYIPWKDYGDMENIKRIK